MLKIQQLKHFSCGTYSKATQMYCCEYEHFDCNHCVRLSGFGNSPHFSEFTPNWAIIKRKSLADSWKRFLYAPSCLAANSVKEPKEIQNTDSNENHPLTSSPVSSKVKPLRQFSCQCPVPSLWVTYLFLLLSIYCKTEASYWDILVSFYF